MRQIYLVLLFLSTFLGLQAQGLQINLGSNLSNVNHDNSGMDMYQQHNGLIGIQWEQALSSAITSAIEVQYSTKGYRTRGAVVSDILWPYGYNNLRFQYMDVIPSFSASINDHMDIILGGNLGFKVLETFNGVTTPSPIHKKIDYGVIAGFKLNAKNYSLRFMANQGLINAANELYITDLNGDEKLLEYRNINFQITLGVKIIDLAKKGTNPST